MNLNPGAGNYRRRGGAESLSEWRKKSGMITGGISPLTLRVSASPVIRIVLFILVSLALHGAVGRMPHVENAEQTSAKTFTSAGLSVTLGMGASEP